MTAENMAESKARNLRWWPLAVAACGLGIILYLLIYVWRRVSPTQHIGDFDFFYYAAKALDQGGNPYEVIPPGRERPGYIYPPLIAFLYWPLAHFFDLVTAARWSLIINLSALCTTLWLGSKAMLERFGEDLRVRGSWRIVAVVALGTLILSFDKIKGDTQHLETNTLILTGMTLGLWFLDRRPIWAGAALGFAMNIKYQAIVLLPYLLIRRRWRAAGWMVAWTAFWGMLPGVVVGFGTEARYLGMAFGGVLRLVGIDAGLHQVADVEPISSGFSISITSAMARRLQEHGSTMSPFVIAGGIAILWLVVVLSMYRGRHVPWLRWPAAERQTSEPHSGWIAIEWMVLIATTLCFSPQTNPRQLVLTTIVNLAAVAILVARRRVGFNWVVAAGIVVLWCGLSLPPGRRVPMTPEQAVTATIKNDTIPTPASQFWTTHSGPSWALLIAAGLIAWGGLSPTRPSARKKALQ